MVTLKSFDGGEFDAYLALPASGYGPGIVVLQEIFGVNSIVVVSLTGMPRMASSHFVLTSSGARNQVFN
jgi:dienelactone hydrolase